MVVGEQEVAEKLRKAEEDKTPTQLPLAWELCSIAPVAVLYTVARFYLLLESALELRNVSGSAYVNVQWTALLPHV
ncbi:hypothetical protein K461DRAFT_48748 [Myriangium duriaei CBS 260.36]|uniref:Uncharacterized protein n=1 Tax=Myriangium duriaei CBS 260.36 TaxID=1168546 RepID=A0A9P4ME48_9PEZI|nr:hypothetical protein K461DRAFT_48748 [Myriangium duriaei CBS 260.36]